MTAKSTPEILSEYHKLLLRDGRDAMAFVRTGDIAELLDYIRELEQRIANLEDSFASVTRQRDHSEYILQGLMQQLQIVGMMPDA